MIQKIPEKTNQPLDLVTYLLRPDKGYVIGNSFVTNPLSTQALSAELNAYREINPRVEHLVSHMSLRLAPGEHLTDQQFQAITADYLQGLGYGDCAYFVVRHTDAASEHIHIVVSRIARDGHCVSDSFDWPRGERLVRIFERQYGLRHVPSSDEVRRQSLTRGELAQALRRQEPSARQALQEIVSQAAGEAQDFPGFVERLATEEVTLIVHLDRERRLHGYSYELEGYAMSGTQLGRGFTLRGIERGYGILPVPEAHGDLLARLGRPSESAAGSSTVSETSGDPVETLRREVRNTLAGATTFEDFVDRLAASGIRLEVQPDRLGRPHGLVYEAKNVRASASSLGRDFTLGALKRRGLVPGEKEVSSGNEVVTTPPRSQSREEASVELIRTIDKVAATSADFRTFREELLTCGIRLEAHYSEGGKPTGLTYHREGYRWAGKELGSAYTLGGLKKTRGLAPECDPVSLQAAQEALATILRRHAREATTFHDFQVACEAEAIKLRLYLSSHKAVGIGYTYKDQYFKARSLGNDFTLVGLRETFHLAPDLEAPEVRRIAVELEASTENEKAMQGVRLRIDQAASDAEDFNHFFERLVAAGIEIKLRYTDAGLPPGLTYHTGDQVFSGKALGDAYTVPGLRQSRGISPDPDPERLAAATEALTSALQRLAPQAASFEGFQTALDAEGIKIRLFTRDNKALGIGYTYADSFFAAQALPARFSLAGLRETFKLTPDLAQPSIQRACVTLPDTMSPERTAAVQSVHERVARCLEHCPDFATFQAKLQAEGVLVEVRHNAAGGVKDLVYEADGKRYPGRALGELCTPRGLRGAGVPAPSDPVARDASRRELTELAHQAAHGGSPPTFTRFGEALEAQGVNLRLYSKEGEPIAVSYRYKDETFAARALGPELTLRGLRAHFEITIADSDRPYVTSISTESTRDIPPPDDTEIRTTLTPLILVAAEGSEDASEFLSLLEEQRIGLRLYLSAEGQPRRLAYEYDQTFYTPKQLGAEVDLPNLIRSHGLKFDPQADAPVFATCGVPLAKNATVSRTDFVPYVAEAVATAAADAPDLPSLVERLNRSAIKLHLLTPADDPSRVVGITYEHKDVFVSARSLGPEYTFTGLQSHFGVTIDPARDADLVRDLSKALPATPPADPRDAWEEVRDRLTLVASEAEDFGTYVARLEESGIHPILRVDEADRLVGITYRVAGRELRDQQLGPDFTPVGLHQAYGLAPQASDRERISANVVQEEDWTRILACRLEIAAGERAALRYAAQRLRRDPLQALRTVANAQYLLSAATNPRLAARVAMAHLPAGRLVSDALSFAAAFRSPVAATVFGLRMASRGFAALSSVRRPEIPSFEAVARRVLGPFLAAAKHGAPSAAVFAHRLRLAGIEPQVVMEASRPTLYYQLADHLIPATDLGGNYTLAAIARHFREPLGGDHGQGHATTAAALDPRWRANTLRPHPIEWRPDSGPDRSSGRAHSPDGDPAAAPARGAQEPGGAPARDPSSEHGPHLTSPCEPAVASVGDPQLNAGTPRAVDPDVPAPELARPTTEALAGSPAERALLETATDRPPVDLEAVKRHLDSLRSDQFDLRIDSPGARPTFLRGLSREQVVSTIPQLWQEAPAGATIGVRPAADPGVQLLRDLVPEQVVQASRRGFQPALTVETAPGRFDVWVRHLAPGTQSVPAEVLNYARRAVRLEYGQPSARKDGAYGPLAGIPGEHFSPRIHDSPGMTYSRATEYIQLLASHRQEAQVALQAALDRLGMPSPRDFHRLNHPTLSRRESDLLWAQRAHLSRLPPHQILSALAAGRERAHEPQSALRYASNLYSVMLRNATQVSPAAAQAATLRALSTATGAPVMLLRLALGVIRPILRVFRP